jgi:hypothetical protein
MRYNLTLLAWLCLCVAAPTSRILAHSGPPVPLEVFAGPGAEPDITIATNYGLLSSALAAESRWGCESGALTAAERYVVQFAPKPQVLALGRGLVAKSVDDGCSWALVDVDGLPVVQVLSDSTSERLAIVTGTRPTPAHPELSAIWLTQDPALERASMRYRSHKLELLSLVSVPSLSALYAGGSDSDTHQPALVRSLDRGVTWQELRPVTPVQVGVLTPLYVDTDDARRLFVRAAGAVDDHLMRSRDGGETLELVADVQGRARDIVQLGPDRLAVLTQIDANQRLYIGPFEGPFEGIDLALHFRDLVAQQGRLIGLVELETSELRLAISQDAGRSWSEYSGVGRNAQLAPCHRTTPECLTDCATMSTYGLITPDGCGATAGDAALPRAIDAGSLGWVSTDAGLDGGSVFAPEAGCALGGASMVHGTLAWSVGALLVLRRRRRLLPLEGHAWMLDPAWSAGRTKGAVDHARAIVVGPFVLTLPGGG